MAINTAKCQITVGKQGKTEKYRAKQSNIRAKVRAKQYTLRYGRKY